jgi:hypothetical protein
MVSMFAMILAPDVQFVGMAALWLQLFLPWVLVAYVGFLPQRFTFAAARAVTVLPNSIMILVLFGAVYNGAVGVAFTYVEVVSQGRLLALAAHSVVERDFKGMWVKVGPWGPVAEVKTIQVPHVIYKVLQPKDPVCLVTRSGALGISWYTAQTCPWTGGKVTLGGSNPWHRHN